MDKEKIGRLIGALRREQGMTQRELAERLHVSDRTVSKWERGAGLPDASLMVALADALGISVNELLTGERADASACTPETRAVLREAAAVIYRHVHARERQLRTRILAVCVLAALLLGGAALALRSLGEERILFPPTVSCELLQRDADVEATLLVDRRNSGVYDYICAYALERGGTVHLQGRRVWQSYTDAVPSAVYDALREVCGDEITRVTALADG